MNTLRPLLLACHGLLYCAMSLHAAPGDLDPTFGVAGKKVTSVGTGSDKCYAAAAYPGGKTVVAGSIVVDGRTDFLLARFDANGEFDAAFGGGDGWVNTPLGSSNTAEVWGIAVLSDGKIVAAGWAQNSATTVRDFAVARYNSNGTLDASFGSGGLVTTDFSNGNDYGYAIAVQSDGKYVVAGTARTGSSDDFALLRFNENGVLDSTFGSGGKVTTNFVSQNDEGRSVALQSDGKIVVGGYASNGVNNDFALARYESGGGLDVSFGSGGKLTTAIGSGEDYGYAIAIEAGGKIVLAGSSRNGSNADIAVARYEQNGSLDVNFGVAGKATTDFNNSNDHGYGVSLTPDGKIVVAGYAVGVTGDFCIARYNANGILDTSFNGTGKTSIAFGGGNTDGARLAVQDDGKYVVAGWVNIGGNNDLALARVLTAPGVPVATTGVTSGKTESSAILFGSVLPAGLDTTVRFEFGLTTAYGSLSSAQSVGNTGIVAVQSLITGLITGATYHYRVTATNSAGTSVGQDATFTVLQPHRYEKLDSFSEPTGTMPLASVVQGTDGAFYGTTSQGGRHGQGTLLRLSSNGKLTTLHNFSGSDGSSPRTSLIQASDGNLYGTTYFGGAENRGTVFRMTPNGQLTSMFSFASQNTGCNPHYELVEASDGHLYGVTQYSSYNSNGQVNFGGGVVFRITKTGQFNIMAGPGSSVPVGGSLGGSSPRSGLTQGSDGALYGGYDNNIYKVTPSGQSSTVVTISSSNSGLNSPVERLVLNDDGFFYGASPSGGTGAVGGIFSVSSGGIYNAFFNSTQSVARNPSSLTKAQDGSLWGIASGGTFNSKTIFKLSPAAEGTTIHHFPAGTLGVSRLVQAADGTFWGTESGSGANGNLGSVFRVNLDNSVTTILRFTGFNLRYDRASLMQTGDGTILGTGSGGGDQQEGNVFSVSPAGVLTKVASFDGATRGSDPGAALVKAADGNYYGTARVGGANSKGTVFRMTPAGVVTVLTAFDGANGAFPEAGLALGGDGHLYGTTKEGGSSNLGTVFRLTTAGVLTVLHHFRGADGSLPLHRLMLAADGHLYGTTSAGGATGNGLIFRLTTASGMVTTVAEMNGANGQAPNELRQLPDGSFVGTTRLGGSGNLGTVFSMAADGTITTLHHFNGTNGQWPESVLARAADGTLYGTTSAGATADGGTLFKIVAGSIFVPVMDFGSVPDEKPTGPVFFGQDGNLYGTTRNSVFRFLFPGAPIADAGSASSVTTTSAVIDAKVNARGSSTQSTIEYGIDGVSFPLSATAAPLSVSGYTTTRVGAALAGLVSGTRYYYRLRSVSSAGTTVSPVASFATQSLAYAATTSATGLGPTGATLNGIVNAFENSTTVTFEYGTDGNTFPFSIAATPATVTGDADTPVAAAIAGLTKGVTYYFRIRATTTAGTTISGATSFRTLIEPLATTGPALALSTTTARVTGTVQARDADTQVFFEYGTSPTTFPNIIAAIPGLVTGDTPISVAADLPNLAAGVTYYFRVRASSAGGLSYSAASSFQLQVLSGFTQVFPPAPPASEGFLVVNLTPSGILHGWRFVGEQQWRASGVPAGGLTTGDRDIEFRPVPGYNQPPRESVGIVSGEAATVITRDYYASSTSGSGGLSVTLKPDSITTGQDRAQWRLLGENDAQWRDSGAGISSLIAGSYLIECKPVTGRATPPNVNVIVSNGATAAPTITYFLPDATAGAPPSVLAFESVTGDTTKPYAHVGQIRSNAGSSSGFVVKARVVATAAHVVWDDGTLSAAQGLQWLFQRHRGTHEPKPVFPRGFYLFDGYAAQRVIDNSPGDSSPQSQTLDVAAMYFDQDAGRGGYGGFLASDLPSNEFLLSNANKMLVGYPVDGVAPTSQGRMHATAPFNVVFNAAFGRTFTTSGIRSSGGNSGGPLCVQFEGGAYYPAAIYLGGDNQTVVRAIDSAVIDLFNRAEVSGNGGGNNTGGGITHTGVTGQLSSSNPGGLQILIEPMAARTAGAGWSLVPASLTPTSTYRQSGAQTSNLSAGDYKVVFLTVNGFQPPVEQSVTVTGGQVNTFTYTYALPMSPQESWRQTYFSTTSNSGNAADSFDFDGDGFTNAQEYAAGTNPTASGDYFKAGNPQRSGNTFSVSAPGKAGRTYVLECSPTMAAGSWMPVGVPQGPLASDQAVTLTDAASPPGAAFYQIRVTGP